MFLLNGSSGVGTVLAIISCCVIVTGAAEAPNPQVCTRSGCVVGVAHEGNNKPYEAFLGLPYARPPTRRFRFQV